MLSAYLARVVAQSLTGEFETSRDFVGHNPLSQESNQRFTIGFVEPVCFEILDHLHDRMYPCAQVGIGQADHDSFSYSRVRHERPFDFRGKDIGPA